MSLVPFSQAIVDDTSGVNIRILLKDNDNTLAVDWESNQHGDLSSQIWGIGRTNCILHL